MKITNEILLEKAKNVNFDSDLDESYKDGLWDLSIELYGISEKQEQAYNEFWFKVRNKICKLKNTQQLWQYLSLLNKQKSGGMSDVAYSKMIDKQLDDVLKKIKENGYAIREGYVFKVEENNV